MRATRNEHLRAVDNVVVAVFAGEGFHGAGVGAAVGFGQAVAGEDVHVDHALPEALFLLVVAEGVQDPGAHVVD